MAEPNTVARPYAEALFKLSADTKAAARWSEALAFLEVVALDPAMAEVIGNPRVGRDQLLGLFAEIGGKRLDEEARHFVAVLAENARLPLMPYIRSQFEALLLEREGVVDAHIRSAFALTEAQTAQLVSDLKVRFKRGIRPDVKVDAALIGGITVSVGDVVIDGSVRGRLSRMDAALKS
jgi:F-type H+-transporting ATPase subunit delta